MASLPKVRYTPEEYLAMERAADHKSEYLSGQIFAMAGATRRHNLIITNVVGELRSQLRGRPCETYPSDMRVRITPTGLYTYPDVVVACGEPQFLDDREDTLLNPVLIIEVLSESTEAHDRGEKLAHYRRLASVAEYLMISQHVCQIERYLRQPDGFWLYAAETEWDAFLPITSVNCSLRLSEVYDRIEFAEPSMLDNEEQ